MARHYNRNQDGRWEIDCQAVRWLKRQNMAGPLGVFAEAGLRMQAVEVVCRLFQFNDGSILESIEDSGRRNWRAYPK